MTTSLELATTSELDHRKNTSKGGVDYWMGRDIQALLGYADWDNFVKVVERAKTSCEKAGATIGNHFRETTEKVSIGSGAVGKRATYVLSRYACYLIAMNGDPSKPAIALAQTYFAVQTRRMEIQRLRLLVGLSRMRFR
jgi:DNA-damage-inducible protein D